MKNRILLGSETCEIIETESSVCPFNNVGQAISYFNNNNPVRVKSINLIELDKHQAKYENGELWACVCVVIWRVLRPIEKTAEGQAFIKWYLVSREKQSQSFEEIAEEYRVSVRTLFRKTSRIRDAIEREMIDEGLINE